MQQLTSIRLISRQFHTGEEPVVVECSDLKTRVCKYSRMSGSAYKLACEIIGASMAKAWGLHAPTCDIVSIKRIHVPERISPHYFSSPCIGTIYIDNLVDITPSSYSNVSQTKDNLLMLLKIALFDFWLANEDRNANNSNMMYSVEQDSIIPIDFGCIFNTATFDYPLSQLTSTDTILYAPLFQHLIAPFFADEVKTMAEELELWYKDSIDKAQIEIHTILESLPVQWQVPTDIVQNKLEELFIPSWIESVWDNFIDNVKENLQYV